MNNSKIVAAVIGGIAAGIGLGLLFAPAKGSTTRTKLFDPFRSREEELKARAVRRAGVIKGVKNAVQETADKASKLTANKEPRNTPLEALKPDSAKHTGPATGIPQTPAPSKKSVTKQAPARATAPKETRPSRTRSNPGSK